MKTFISLDKLLCNSTFIMFNGDWLRVNSYDPQEQMLYLEDEDSGLVYDVSRLELEFPRDKVYVLEEATYEEEASL